MLTEITTPLSDPRAKKHYYFVETPLRRLVMPLLRFIHLCCAHLEVNGAEHLPARGPAVLAANHVTNLDVFPLQLSLPRQIFFMGKAELFHNPLADLALRQMGGFPVMRGAHDEWALAHAQRVLEHQQVLGIFPEGKRSHGNGLHTAKTGAARLARAASCPIVPVAMTGTQTYSKKFPHRASIKVMVGVPLYPIPGETVLGLTDRMMFAIASMLPLEMRGMYAEKPKGF